MEPLEVNITHYPLQIHNEHNRTEAFKAVADFFSLRDAEPCWWDQKEQGNAIAN